MLRDVHTQGGKKRAGHKGNLVLFCCICSVFAHPGTVRSCVPALSYPPPPHITFSWFRSSRFQHSFVAQTSEGSPPTYIYTHNNNGRKLTLNYPHNHHHHTQTCLETYTRCSGAHGAQVHTLAASTTRLLRHVRVHHLDI